MNRNGRKCERKDRVKNGGMKLLEVGIIADKKEGEIEVNKRIQRKIEENKRKTRESGSRFGGRKQHSRGY